MLEDIEAVLVQAAPETKRSTDEGDIAQLADGRLLFVWSHYDTGSFPEAPTQLLSKTSDDDGRTWSQPFTLVPNPAKESRMCCSLLRTASGALLLFYGVRKSNSDFQVHVCRSCDDAHNWSEPVRVTSTDGYCVMINSRVTQLVSGRIIAPVERTDDCGKSGHVIISTVFFSDDEGRTWCKSRSDISLPKRGALEPDVVELADRRLLMFVRTQLGQVYRSYSQDEGVTWTEAEPSGVVAPASAHVALGRVPATGDAVLVRTQGTSPDSLTAAISADGGESWHVREQIEPPVAGSIAYPSVNFAGERVLFTYWMRNAGGPDYMKFHSLPLARLYR